MLTRVEVREALHLYRQAENTPAEPERRRLYLAAASAFVEVAAAMPKHWDTPLFLEYAGTALERAGRYANAVQLFEREANLVRANPNRFDRAPNAYERFLAHSMFRIAYDRYRAFDPDGAVLAYQALLAEPRLSSVNDARVVAFIADARVNFAIVLNNLQRYREAEAAYRRVAATTNDDSVRRTAEYRAHLMAAHQRRPQARGRLLARFARQHASDPDYAGATAGALLAAAGAFRDANMHAAEGRMLRSLANRRPSEADEELIARAVARLDDERPAELVPIEPVDSTPTLAD